MKTKKLIQKITVLGVAAVFFAGALAPTGGYGAGLTADFSHAPKADNPLQINFTDQSTSDIAKWKWDFGDGSLPFIISHQQKPEGMLVNTSIELATIIPNVSGNVIVCRTDESLLGKDLNNNGKFDPVLQYYDITAKTLVVVNPIAIASNRSPNISGETIAFVTNGITMYYDVRKNKIVSTDAETDNNNNPSISGNIIAFITSETSIGSDLDGNGLVNDVIVQYFDTTVGKVFNTKGIIFPSNSPRVFGNIIAFPAYEQQYGGDLNGDGDKNDLVLRYFNIINNRLVNTAAEMVGGDGFAIFSDKIAFVSREASVGVAGVDLNGDGDTRDFVVRYFDVSTGRIINTGAEIKVVVSTKLFMSEYIIAFVTSEAFMGKDLNGDGDTSDDVLRYYDFSTEKVVNTGAEIYTNPSVDGKRIAFLTDEKTVGRSGADLNGDGDTGGLFPDIVVRYFDTSTGMLSNTGAEASGTNLSISGNVIAFQTSEKTIGAEGLDLNGNGNLEERMLRYFVIGEQTFNGNTSHLYNEPGTYNVTLTVTNKNNQVGSITKSIEVREVASLPTASFTASRTSGEAPLPVQFTDTSSNNPSSWLWGFGDGSSPNNTQNPVHTYTTAGTYSVSLTVANEAGSNTKTIPNLITVTAPDTTPPIVSITEPLDNAAVKDTIIIKVNASD